MPAMKVSGAKMLVRIVRVFITWFMRLLVAERWISRALINSSLRAAACGCDGVRLSATVSAIRRLATSPARNFLNTSFNETPTSLAREGRPEVMVHPDDAEPLGIADGAKVRLGNERGSVVLHARRFEGVVPGVLVAESIWPNSAFEDGCGINSLTGADPVAPFGGAAFHDTRVWLRAEPEAGH